MSKTGMCGIRGAAVFGGWGGQQCVTFAHETISGWVFLLPLKQPLVVVMCLLFC